jgi:hypothetical protein
LSDTEIRALPTFTGPLVGSMFSVSVTLAKASLVDDHTVRVFVGDPNPACGNHADRLRQ